MTSAARVAPPGDSVEAQRAHRPWAWRLPSRVGTLCLLELQKLRHDRTELITRIIQPALWLTIFGTTFTQLRVIPTGDVPYLDYLAPGILALAVMSTSL